MKDSIWYIFRLMYREKRTLLWGYMLSAFLRALSYAVPVLVTWALVDALEKSHMERAILWAVVLCLAVFLISAMSALLSGQSQEKAIEFQDLIHLKLANTLCQVDYNVFETKAFRGDFRFAEECLENGSIEKVLQAVVEILGGLLSFITLAAVMAQFTWWLLLIIFASICIQMYCRIWQIKKNFETLREQESTEYKMLYSRDRLTWKSFAKEVRLFSMVEYVKKQANCFIDALSQIQKRHASRIFRAYLFSSLVNGLQLFAVYAYVIQGGISGLFTIAEFSALAISMLSVTREAAAFAENLVSIQDNAQYMRGYVDILRMSDNKSDSPDALKITKPVHEIAFDNVTFFYEGRDEPALKNLSVTLTAGRKYGIVGVNGSGKTTFTNLLMGLYTPAEGSVQLDGTDIRKLRRKEYVGLFSVVFQDFHTFAYTVRENLMAGDTELARIRDVLLTLGFPNEPALLDTYITNEYGENGREFSGGEEQKLAIARALLRDTPFYVFDEPSSSLSPHSEAELYRVIGEQLKDRTVFLISHRLGSCIHCDEILVFDGGEIVERGSHHTLMGKHGLYYEMFTHQKELYTDEDVRA